MQLTNIGVARGGQKGHSPPQFLETIVILYFEKRFYSVIRLKSSILAPQKIFGLATSLLTNMCIFMQNQQF